METGENIGMMSGAYFVGRQEILRWINDLTGLSYGKIEQTASGVFACHVFDALFPDSIRFEKVRFNARASYDFVHNYKVLQAAFDRLNMKKQIDVEKLIKGKYQDNLEFMQWVKAFYDSHANDNALQYDGRTRRAEIMERKGMRPAPLQSRNLENNTRRTAGNSSSKPVSSRRTKPAGNVVSKAKYDQLVEENKKLSEALTDAETERTFYYEKLRDVEMIYQNVQDDRKEGEVTVDILLNALEDIKAAMYAEDGVAEGEGAEENYDDNLPPEEYEVEA